jgi:hypothetical protein
LGNLVFGEAAYQNGILTDTYLESRDFGLSEQDENKDTYTFEGNTYESEYDILEILLERKQQKK